MAGSFAERLMGMDAASWERHANPLSVYTRYAALPLLALRGDRPMGSAEADFHAVHDGLRYDLELDTGLAADPDDNAGLVLSCWAGPRGRSAFFAGR